jgi:hypothetical protein
MESRMDRDDHAMEQIETKARALWAQTVVARERMELRLER